MIMPFKNNQGEVRFHDMPEPLPFAWVLLEACEFYAIKIKADNYFADSYERRFHLEKLLLTENPIYIEDSFIL